MLRSTTLFFQTKVRFLARSLKQAWGNALHIPVRLLMENLGELHSNFQINSSTIQPTSRLKSCGKITQDLVGNNSLGIHLSFHHNCISHSVFITNFLCEFLEELIRPKLTTSTKESTRIYRRKSLPKVHLWSVGDIQNNLAKISLRIIIDVHTMDLGRSLTRISQSIRQEPP